MKPFFIDLHGTHCTVTGKVGQWQESASAFYRKDGWCCHHCISLPCPEAPGQSQIPPQNRDTNTDRR